MILSKNNVFRKEDITVQFFYKSTKDRFHINLVTKDILLDRPITEQNLHRPGLALAGFVDLFSYKRIQICGNTEAQYLKKLSVAKRKHAAEKLFGFNIPCMIFTDNNRPSPAQLHFCQYRIFRL